MKCNSQFAQNEIKNLDTLHNKNFFTKILYKLHKNWARISWFCTKKFFSKNRLTKSWAYGIMEILGAATVRAPLFYHTSFLLSSLFIKKIKKWSRFSKSAPTGKEVRKLPCDWNRWESNPLHTYEDVLYSIPFLFFIITFLFYFVKGAF